MILNTISFGQIEIDDKSIIRFEEGIPGFDNIKDYAIINIEDSPFKWLQCIEDEYLTFPIINPFEVKKDYEFNIDETTEKHLHLKNTDDVAVYSIVVIPNDDISKMTANLKAPIIVNVANNKAKQMIMDNSPYEVKHYILNEIIKEKAEGDKEEK